MKTKHYYGAKEYFGNRPCLDPEVMRYLQVKLRSVQTNPVKQDLLTKIKNLIQYYK